MKYLLLTLKIALIAIALISAVIAAPFIVLFVGSFLGVEAINSYSLMQSFMRYRSIVDKVPSTEAKKDE
jgi:hypothetical protein